MSLARSSNHTTNHSRRGHYSHDNTFSVRRSMCQTLRDLTNRVESRIVTFLVGLTEEIERCQRPSRRENRSHRPRRCNQGETRGGHASRDDLERQRDEDDVPEPEVWASTSDIDGLHRYTGPKRTKDYTGQLPNVDWTIYNTECVERWLDESNLQPPTQTCNPSGPSRAGRELGLVRNTTYTHDTWRNDPQVATASRSDEPIWPTRAVNRASAAGDPGQDCEGRSNHSRWSDPLRPFPLSVNEAPQKHQYSTRVSRSRTTKARSQKLKSSLKRGISQKKSVSYSLWDKRGHRLRPVKATESEMVMSGTFNSKIANARRDNGRIENDRRCRMEDEIRESRRTNRRQGLKSSLESKGDRGLSIFSKTFQISRD